MSELSKLVPDEFVVSGQDLVLTHKDSKVVSLTGCEPMRMQHLSQSHMLLKHHNADTLSLSSVCCHSGNVLLLYTVYSWKLTGFSQEMGHLTLPSIDGGAITD